MIPVYAQKQVLGVLAEVKSTVARTALLPPPPLVTLFGAYTGT